VSKKENITAHQSVAEQSPRQQEPAELIALLLDACQEALKLRSLECYILTKQGLQPYEMQTHRDEAAAIERKIRVAIARANQFEQAQTAIYRK